MGLFDRKTPELKQVDTRNPQQQATDAFLANFLQTYGSQYKPGQAYTGPLSAGMTGYEKQGQDYLGTYLNQPMQSPELTAARDYFTKSLTGQFDPRTSDMYGAFRDQAQINRNEAVKATNADLGARNKYFSSEAGNKYGDINMKTGAALNTEMARLADVERQRQQANAQAMPAFDQYVQGIPLERAKAASTIGAIPRTLEQADLERRYQDFIRKQTELGGVVKGASPSNVGMSSYWTPGAPSSFESFMSSPLMGALLQGGLGMMTGGASLPFTGAAGAAGAGASSIFPGVSGLTGALGNQGGFWNNLLV